MPFKLRKLDAIIIVILIIIAGAILYQSDIIPHPPKPEPPRISFEQDEKSHKLVVTAVDSVVRWSDINIEGQCNTSHLTTYVAIGDEITNCNGLITITYKPTDMVYGSWTFILRNQLPVSFPYSLNYPPIGTTPADEGAHYNKLGVNREMWFYSVVFDEDSDLAGWSVVISFNHMARNDLPLAKPDMLVVTLHGPNEGEQFGGMVNKQRGRGLIWDPTLEVKSSEKEIILEFEDSWVQGMYPTWKIHIEDKDIDKNHDIKMDLEFFAPNLAIWTYNSRPINEGKSKIASYMFTGCSVTGDINIDGAEYDVKGIGHHEHLWSTGLINSFIHGWDWTHITLDNGWNMYYNNYYLTSQLLSSSTHKINPLCSLIITTDKGNTLTLLEDVEITFSDSERVGLLLKRPTEIDILAKPGFTQPLLQTYDVFLDITINFDRSIGKTYIGLDTVAMNVGRSTVSGSISWNDEEGDHDININGIGSMWTMRH